MSFARSRELGFALHDVARLLRTYRRPARARNVDDPRPMGGAGAAAALRGRQPDRAGLVLDLTPITVVRLIDKLDAAGFVERRPDAHDRRIHRLYLTEKAAPALETFGELSERIMDQALAGLDEPTLTTLKLASIASSPI